MSRNACRRRRRRCVRRIEILKYRLFWKPRISQLSRRYLAPRVRRIHCTYLYSRIYGPFTRDLAREHTNTPILTYPRPHKYDLDGFLFFVFFSLFFCVFFFFYVRPFVSAWRNDGSPVRAATTAVAAAFIIHTYSVIVTRRLCLSDGFEPPTTCIIIIITYYARRLTSRQIIDATRKENVYGSLSLLFVLSPPTRPPPRRNNFYR